MKELEKMLLEIADSYEDFVRAILHYAGKSNDRLEKLLFFIGRNPGICSSDVVRFVSEQEDFAEDISYTKAS